jgi:xanthine/CO dehydrogenase XdhC/CoxF family maturation factor
MTDWEQILPLWRDLESRNEQYVLATVVAVEGSSYRRPGASMLLARDGRRAGTVSGGCLEAAVAKKAWWLTESDPAVQRYSTLDDDGDLPYGSGCGGIVWILLERADTARTFLAAMEAAFEARAALSVATVVRGQHVGARAFASPVDLPSDAANEADAQTLELQPLADRSLLARESVTTNLMVEEPSDRVWVSYHSPRPAIWVFGAGDDARPLANLARELGWYVGIADGRAHLATRARFPQAHEVHAINIAEVPGQSWPGFTMGGNDAAILLTHSFEQDARILAAIMQSGRLHRLGYIGVLGPQRRTREVLAEAASILGQTTTSEEIEADLEQLHAPTGLDLGGEAPAAVALSIVAEVQKALTQSSGLALREVRAVPSSILS